MTVLTHRVLDAQGRPVAGLVATVAVYAGAQSRPGSYHRDRATSAVSDDDGLLTWTLPSWPGRGTPTYVVSGIEPRQVLVSVPPTMSTATVTETRTGTLPLPPGQEPGRDLVTQAELAQRLAGLTADITPGTGAARAYAPRWSPRSVPGEAGLPRRMATPPTLGYVYRWVEEPSAIPNARLVPAVLNPDGAAALNTAAFSFRGGPWQQKTNAYPGFFFAKPQDLAGENCNFPYVEFLYYGADFEFGYFAQGWLATRVWVDGQLAEDVFTAPDPQDGNGHFRRVTFPAPGWRRIRLDVLPNGFYGVFTGPADAVIALPAPTDKLLAIGDSFAEGTGSNGFDAYVTMLGQMLGFGEVVGASQGSTGLLAMGPAGWGRSNYLGRAAAWPQIGATHVLVQFSRNDDSFTDAQRVQGTRDLLPVLEALPGRPELWFVGTWASSGDLSYPRAADAAIRPVIEAAGHLFVSQVEPTAIWTGTGHAGAPAGDGTSDVLVGPDGTHPTPAGHEGIARSLFARLMAALNA